VLRPLLQIAAQAQQVLGLCEARGSDKVALEYDARNPFDICSLTFTPIYRGNQFSEDPYTKARCGGPLLCPPSAPQCLQRLSAAHEEWGMPLSPSSLHCIASLLEPRRDLPPCELHTTRCPQLVAAHEEVCTRMCCHAVLLARLS
jgi:hypothetical protein